jgi:hypothetical protein
MKIKWRTEHARHVVKKGTIIADGSEFNIFWTKEFKKVKQQYFNGPRATDRLL